jgi:hypothetical protein
MSDVGPLHHFFLDLQCGVRIASTDLYFCLIGFVFLGSYMVYRTPPPSRRWSYECSVYSVSHAVQASMHFPNLP